MEKRSCSVARGQVYGGWLRMSKPGGAQCRSTYPANELTVYKKKTAPDAAYVGLEHTLQTEVVTMADCLATQQLPEKEREAILRAAAAEYRHQLHERIRCDARRSSGHSDGRARWRRR